MLFAFFLVLSVCLPSLVAAERPAIAPSEQVSGFIPSLSQPQPSVLDKSDGVNNGIDNDWLSFAFDDDSSCDYATNARAYTMLSEEDMHCIRDDPIDCKASECWTQFYMHCYSMSFDEVNKMLDQGYLPMEHHEYEDDMLSATSGYYYFDFDDQTDFAIVELADGDLNDLNDESSRYGILEFLSALLSATFSPVESESPCRLNLRGA